jgi:NTP pyrophosphatase (non-canonical NTP hydrolase)
MVDQTGSVERLTDGFGGLKELTSMAVDWRSMLLARFDVDEGPPTGAHLLEEAGELIEAVADYHLAATRGYSVVRPTDAKRAVEREAADVLLCLVYLADRLDFDLLEAAWQKLFWLMDQRWGRTPDGYLRKLGSDKGRPETPLTTVAEGGA